MKQFDTHAHLNSEEFHENLPLVLQRAHSIGVSNILVVGTTAASSASAEHLTTNTIACIVRLVSSRITSPGFNLVIGSCGRISKLPSVVALGETGLDRYWHDTPFDQQQDYFDRHLHLSQKTGGSSFIVHMRDCGGRCGSNAANSATRGELRGVMHSFTGDEIAATRVLRISLCYQFCRHGNVQKIRGVAFTRKTSSR